MSRGKFSKEIAALGINLEDGQWNGYEVLTFCPFHDNTHTPAFRINTDTGLWVCFVCTRESPRNGIVPLGGNIKSLARRLGKKFLDSEVELDILVSSVCSLKEGIYYSNSNIDTRVRAREWETFKSLLPSSSEAMNFLSKTRSLSVKAINEWKLGYEPASNRITIPMFSDDCHYLGSVKRALDDDDEPRYRYPKGFNRNKNVFGIERAAGLPLVLVEGTLDAIRTWDILQPDYDVAAILGSYFSGTQCHLIRSVEPTEVIIFTDHDDAGRKAAASIASELRGLVVLKEVNWRGMLAGDDPGSIDAADIKRLVSEATYV